MHLHVSVAALSACLLLVAPTVTGKEGDRERQTNEKQERERARQELRLGPEERPEGPAKTDPNEHIDDHLRREELLDVHPVEIPERFEKGG